MHDLGLVVAAQGPRDEGQAPAAGTALGTARRAAAATAATGPWRASPTILPQPARAPRDLRAATLVKSARRSGGTIVVVRGPAGTIPPCASGSPSPRSTPPSATSRATCAKILAGLEQARALGAQLVAFPELAITGYPPEDLLFKSAFIEANLRALADVARATTGLTAVVGFVDKRDDIFNAAAVLHDGAVAGVYHKQYLPNYGVFDENRYFQAGTEAPVFTLGDTSLRASTSARTSGTRPGPPPGRRWRAPSWSSPSTARPTTPARATSASG